MRLSDYPELRAYRDELAGKIQRKRGGPYSAALEAANATALRICKAAAREGEDARPKAVARVVREVVRTVGVTEMAAPKVPPKKPKKRTDAVIGEAVRQAVARVFAEAANRAPVHEADSRPLHELSDGELTDRIGEAALRQWQPQPVTESGDPASAALRGMDLTSEPLHELDHDSFMDLFGAAMVADGEQRLSSPLFGGANTVPSPFMRGL